MADAEELEVAAEPAAEAPAASFTFTVAVEAAKLTLSATAPTKTLVKIEVDGEEPVLSAAVDGADPSYGCSLTFERSKKDDEEEDDFALNGLAGTAVKISVLAPAAEEGGEPMLLGTAGATFDALLEGKQSAMTWVHVAPAPAAAPAAPTEEEVAAKEAAFADKAAAAEAAGEPAPEPEAEPEPEPAYEVPEGGPYPELCVTLSVDAPLFESAEAAEESGFVTVELGPLLKIPEACQITEVQPAPPFAYCFSMDVPMTGKKGRVSLSSDAGRAAAAADATEGMQSIGFGGFCERLFLQDSAMRKLKGMAEKGRPLKGKLWRAELEGGEEGGASTVKAGAEPVDWDNLAAVAEDGGVNKFAALLSVDLSPLLIPGTTTLVAECTLAPPPSPEFEEQEGEEEEAAAARKEAHAAAQAELGANPFAEAGSSVKVSMTFSTPLIRPLPSPSELPQPKDIIPPRPKLASAMQSLNGEEELGAEIKEAMDSLLAEFQAMSTNFSDSNDSDEIRRQFIFELNSSGKYFSMKEKLKKSVVRVAKERFKTPGADSKAEKDAYIAQLYVYLMGQMHRQLNNTFSAAAMANKDGDAKPQPPSVEKLSALASEAEGNLEYDLAAKYMQDIVAQRDDDAGAWKDYALFCFRTGDAAKGTQCLREAVSIDDQNTEVLVAYAGAMLDEGNSDSALAFLHGAVEVDPSASKCWLILGATYHSLGKTKDAESCTREAARLGGGDGGDSSPNLATAEFFQQMRLTSLAEQALLREQAENGSSFALSLALGKLYLANEDFERAEENLKGAVSADTTSFSAWATLGDVHFMASRADEAISAYEQALKLGSFALTSQRLGSLYNSRTQFAKARAVFYAACQSAPSATSWLGLGLAYYGLEELRNMEDCLSQANILDNQNVIVWGYLAVMCLLTNRDAEASLAYKEALRLGLNNAELLRDIGQRQLDAGKYSAAEGSLRRCVALSEGDAKARLLLGSTLMMLSKLDDASEQLDMAIRDGEMAADVDYAKELKAQVVAAMG